MQRAALVWESTLDPIASGAAFSQDRRYRYRLWRGLRAIPARLVFVMLNPSKAGASNDDMTITKCLGFAERLGVFGIVEVVNLYGYIATDPDDLWATTNAIGEHNDEVIYEVLARMAFTPGSYVVAAWGDTGVPRMRESEFIAIARRAGIKEIHCLGRTKGGFPRHPSRVGYSAKLASWWKP